MDISIIAAVAKNGVIGSNDGLPWRNEPWVRQDLQRFKLLTAGYSVIMGRKTYESIVKSLGHPLPDRNNIVVTRNLSLDVSQGVRLAQNTVEATRIAFQYRTDKAFVIGGAQIYKEMMPFTNKMHLTEITRDYPGDAFFPEWDRSNWNEVFNQQHEGFAFVDYNRK